MSTKDELTDAAIRIADGLAQELQEFYDAAIAAGGHLPTVRSLLDDWHQIRRSLLDADNRRAGATR